MQVIKNKLYQYCVDYVQKRISNANSAMEEAQSSANSETKSTAGDKHDTARAMMQLAAEQNSKHLAEANKLKQVLPLLKLSKKHTKVALGSVVKASNGTFYIGLSIGKIELDNQTYFSISPTAPMGQILMGLKVGEETVFNGNSIKIIAIA